MFGLNLKNYRCFKDQSFDFSKINILIGENSSGKSSLIKFFLALKQTMDIPNNKETNLALSGQYADLGNYKETIYYNDETLPLSFEFNLKEYYNYFRSVILLTQGSDSHQAKSQQLKKIETLIGNHADSDVKISISLTKNVNQQNAISTSISSEIHGVLRINFPKEKKNISSLIGQVCSLELEKDGEIILLKDLRFEKDGFLTLVTGASLLPAVLDHLGKTMNDYNEDEVIKFEADKLFHIFAYMLITQNYLKFYIDKIDYVNPIKTLPNRIYFVKDVKQSNQINDIEDFVNFFGRDTEQSRKMLPEFIKILEEFGILSSLEIIKDDRLPVTELRVKIKNLLSNINDVGYGVSLQLPIILKCFLAEVVPERRGSIIFIEQPEVHLHPKLHANFIATLLKLSKYTTYFIETHSEHIVRKLQVAVKDKKYKLNSQDVSLHYLIRDEEQSNVTVHSIGKDGKLNPSFPTGFFDNSYQLSKALLD